MHSEGRDTSLKRRKNDRERRWRMASRDDDDTFPHPIGRIADEVTNEAVTAC
jgi:hypothetical protein